MPITTFTPPTDCNAVALGAINQDDCFPTQKQSELTYMFIAQEDAKDFDDASSASEWAERLSQTTTVPSGGGGGTVTAKDLIRRIAIIGDMPAPGEQEKDISGGRKFAASKDFVINFEVDDITPAEYEFFRPFQYGIQNVKAWVKSKGGTMLGGNKGLNNGVEVRLKAWPVFGRGTDEIEKIVGTLTWKGQVAPDRFVSPV